MSKEIDVYNLPDSHLRYGDRKRPTRDCPDCEFNRMVVNHTWAAAHEPIGQVCLWGRRWKWLDNYPINNLRSCPLLSRPLSEGTISAQIKEDQFNPLGIRGEDFTFQVFEDALRLYRQVVGGERLYLGEAEMGYDQALAALNRTNAFNWRLGSFVSFDSKFMIEWRFLAPATMDQALFFSCNPNTRRQADQGEYLNSRYEIAMARYLQVRNLAVALQPRTSDFRGEVDGP